MHGTAGVVVISAYSAAFALLIFYPLKMLNMLRVNQVRCAAAAADCKSALPAH